MGFIKDVEAMPDEYDYSLKFFDRYYRPEYTTIIVAGDVDPKRVRSMIDERWGTWKRGNYKPSIPAEPPQDAPRTAHVDWPSGTLPLIEIAYRGPAYSDNTEETTALDAISRLGFDQTSALYQKLVIEEQKLDSLNAGPPNNIDPELFGVFAQVKESGGPAFHPAADHSHGGGLRGQTGRSEKARCSQGTLAVRVRTRAR